MRFLPIGLPPTARNWSVFLACSRPAEIPSRAPSRSGVAQPFRRFTLGLSWVCFLAAVLCFQHSNGFVPSKLRACRVRWLPSCTLDSWQSAIGRASPFKIRQNHAENRCKQLITKAILAVGSFLVEMAYLDENKCFILMGSFAAAGRDLRPCRSSASDRRSRWLGYRLAVFWFAHSK